MSKKLIIPYDVLYDLYITQGLSQAQVAKHLGCCTETATRLLKEVGIPTHKQGSWAVHNPIILTVQQTDYLYGALLGDGCLHKHPDGINSQFTYMSKSEQHVSFVMSLFKEYLLKEGIKKISYIDNRTNKEYTTYSARTQLNPTFQSEYERWYINGKKVIPKDLVLNSTICLLWYIGDGALCNGKNHQHIQLSTDCFTFEEVHFLSEQLADFEAHPVKNEGKYRIYIPRHKIRQFLDYIGPCPFEDYLYKWDFKGYKNFSLKNKPELLTDFIKLFDADWSANTIAKELHVSPDIVRKYLAEAGLDYKQNLFKRKKVICE